MDLSGNWEGFYAYEDMLNSESLDKHSEEYRRVKISASFEQSLNVLTGYMRDIKPEVQTAPFKQHLFQHRKAYGLKNFLAWQKVLFFRPNLEIEHANPLEASCNGHVRGDGVYFVKTYAAPSTHRYLENGVPLSQAKEPMLPVTYQGALSADGSLIQGKWSLAPQNALDGTDVPGLEGLFEFRRCPPIC